MNSIWQRFSVRERRLAVAVGGLTIAAIIMMIVSSALTRVEDLDLRIDRLERDLELFVPLAARGKSVDKAFAEVAQQHSSEWTEVEIRDRLRQEIYRLALENPDAPPDSGNALVEIPSLRQGVLKEIGPGYREYQQNIRVTPTDIYSVVIFVVRLMQSPQSLRIDELELSRAPNSMFVDATITVTRTVVAGGAEYGETPEEAAEAAEPGEAAAWDGSAIEPWTTHDCEAEVVKAVGDLVPEGGTCLRLKSDGPNSTAGMRLEVEPGASYVLSMDVMAEGKTGLAVRPVGATEPLEGAAELPADGAVYRQQIVFTMPEGDGEKVEVLAPYLTLVDFGATVYVDNVTLKKMED